MALRTRRILPIHSLEKGSKSTAPNKPVHDEVYDAIASHQKSVFLVQSHIGQEEGRTTMLASPALKRIGASCTHNTSNTYSRKLFEKCSANKPVHDEEDDAITTHQKSMFLVHSYLVQEDGRTKMVDNLLMTSSAQVIQNTAESTSAPTQVTNHTYNSTGIDTKNNYKDKNCGDRGNDDGSYSFASPKNLCLGCVSIHVEAISSSLSGTNYGTPPHTPARDINFNGAAFQSKKT